MWLPVWNICVTNDHGYALLGGNASRSFPRSWLITGFVTILTRRVSLVEHELLILPGHLRSPPVFSEVRVAQSLILCVCFVDRCLSFCPVLSVLLWFTDSDYPFAATPNKQQVVSCGRWWPDKTFSGDPIECSPFSVEIKTWAMGNWF